MSSSLSPAASSAPVWESPGSKKEPVEIAAAVAVSSANVVEPPPLPPELAATTITITAAAAMTMSERGPRYHGFFDDSVAPGSSVAGAACSVTATGVATGALPTTPPSETFSVHVLPSQYRNWCAPVGSGYQFASVAMSLAPRPSRCERTISIKVTQLMVAHGRAFRYGDVQPKVAGGCHGVRNDRARDLRGGRSGGRLRSGQQPQPPSAVVARRGPLRARSRVEGRHRLRPARRRGGGRRVHCHRRTTTGDLLVPLDTPRRGDGRPRQLVARHVRPHAFWRRDAAQDDRERFP